MIKLSTDKMTSTSNLMVLERIIKILIKKIGRRTSESFAAVLIDKVLTDLKKKYTFLEYITITNTQYSEGINAITIQPDINSIKPTLFYEAIKEIIQKTVQHLERNADFYFIREFQQAIRDIDDFVLKDENINLGFMQHEYIDYRKKALRIKNSQVIKYVFEALLRTLSYKMPIKQAFQNLIVLMEKLTSKYDFLEYIQLSEIQDSEDIFSIESKPDIDNIWSGQIAAVIETIVEQVGKSSDWERYDIFLNHFKIELGRERLNELETIGVNFHRIQSEITRTEFNVLVEKVLEVLIQIISEKTSQAFAIVIIDKILMELRKKYEILQSITIDKSQYSKGIESISILPNINLAEPYQLGKAMRDIIRFTRKNLGDEAYSFIDDFKNKLGADYISEIEDLGVNLHFLEMEYI